MTSLGATLASGTRSVLRDGVARGALGTLALNVSATGLNFLVTLALTNALGARGYGSYAFAFAWATVLTVPAVMGLSPLIVRSVARYQVNSEWGLLRGILRHSHFVGVLSSVLIASVAALVGGLALAPRPDLLVPFLIGLLLVPLLSLTTMRQAAMQGLGKVVIARVPETLVAPGAFLVLAVAAWIVLGESFSASLALSLQITASASAFLLGLWLLRRAVPREIHTTEARYETRAWAASAIPLVWMSLAAALSMQLATILLGALDSSAEAGIYNAASRAALFVSFLFMAAGYAVTPALARLHAEGRLGEQQELLTRAVRLLSLCSLPVAAVLLLFAPQVLSIFGGDFAGATAMLRILVIGEIIRVASGFAWTALVMAGQERRVTVITVAALAMNLALCLVLIPPLGGEGAAIAMTGTSLANQAALVWLAWRRLSLSTAIVPMPARADAR